MKKLFTILTAVTFTVTMFAQDLTSKKGENYMPEEGDWSIGFDATPLLNYFGNFVGNSDGSNSAPSVSAPYGSAFYGKMMIDDETAWRVRLEVDMGSNSATTPNRINYMQEVYTIIDEQRQYDSQGNFIGFVNGPNGPIVNAIEVDSIKRTTGYEDDKITNTQSTISLWFGKEWRKGTTRLQGVYGAEAGIGIGSSSVKYEYGHEASLWYRDMDDIRATRPVEIKNGGTFTLGLRGFIGAEYFILPKMSLGAEYGWGMAMNSTGSGTQTIETTKGVEYKTADNFWEARPFNLNESNGPGSFDGPFDDVKYTPNTYTTTSEDVPGPSDGLFNFGHLSRATIALNLYF